jgi:hypothetical protein
MFVDLDFDFDFDWGRYFFVVVGWDWWYSNWLIIINIEVNWIIYWLIKCSYRFDFVGVLIGVIYYFGDFIILGRFENIFLLLK